MDTNLPDGEQVATSLFHVDEAPARSRYVVGIDLGTTNSAIGFIDTQAENWQVQTFEIPQLVAAGEVEVRSTLPSFHYESLENEFSADALRLPWETAGSRAVVGLFAREHGGLVPGRQILSAKSWLSHSGIDRTASVLPWHGAADVERLSPVEVSARYLAHLAQAWNHRFPDDLLEQQDLILTLPASFDEVARELTIKAAAKAGLNRVVLIEEPQAAFYAWINDHRDDWESLVSPGQKILVCDIGGGTTDFTLIRVRQGSDGKVIFHRVAVGDHLILGGDNLDLALAHHLEPRLAGNNSAANSAETSGKLEPRAWSILVRSCRKAKETLLGENPPDQTTVNLPGSGSRVIGGGRQAEITRVEAEAILADGFFPACALDDRPTTRRSGFQEFGLPYAPDAGMTRYLAAFLKAHRHVALDALPTPGSSDIAASPLAVDHDPARPDIVLFNGGVFESPVLRDRLLSIISGWFSTPEQPWSPVLLKNDRLDLAVAHGAAYYGMVRRGVGVRISAGLARSYYIGIEAAEGAGEDQTPQAMCLVPAGVEPGTEIELTEHAFNLLIRQPVEFPIFVSSTRLTDRAGELVAVDLEQMSALPPIRTVLKSGKKSGTSETVTVLLQSRLTEIGTLELGCREVDGPRRWRIQFDVRSATQTDLSAHQGSGEQSGVVDEDSLEACQKLIRQTFNQPNARAGDSPDGLMKRLHAELDLPRDQWPPSLLRGLWETLIEFEQGRRLSINHEARWLNLTGFSLRPGYGLAVDDWRVSQTLRRLQGKIYHGNAMCKAEWWVLWRRIAGGLTTGQQQALADPLIAEVRALHRGRIAGVKGRAADFSFAQHEAVEVIRLLGSLELLNMRSKLDLGEMLLDLLPREKVTPLASAYLWAIGRLGARVPVYGPLNQVLAPEAIEPWLQRLDAYSEQPEATAFAVMQLARKTEDRFRDISEKQRTRSLQTLHDLSAPEHFSELVRQLSQLREEEQGLVFGEALPVGLRIR